MLTEQEARDAVIIALDCDRERAFELARLLEGKASWVKVGMTLFYRYGPSIVDEMRDHGLKVFLDLKVHDIPFQVKGAVRSAALTGADIISIHGLGTSAMVAAAREGAEEAAQITGRDRCRLVAISVLTSMSAESLAEIGVAGTIEAGCMALLLKLPRLEVGYIIEPFREKPLAAAMLIAAIMAYPVLAKQIKSIS